MHSQLIQDHLPQIHQLGDEYGVEYLGVFGSFARGEEQSDSDLDLLVTFRQKTGLFTLVRLQNQLSKLVGIPVDLIPKKAVNKHIEPYILADLQTIYEKKS